MWLASAFALALAATDADAAEGGASFYIPGLAVPSSGILPPPGAYFDTTGYFYQAELGGQRVVLNGNLLAKVKVDIKADFATALWVTPVEIFGGNLAFSATLPFGDPGVRAGTIFSGPIINRLVGHPVGSAVADSVFNAGDPILSSSVGWHAGNWHWKIAGSLSIPAGAYRDGELSNIALNRYVGDFSGALTYLEPTLGLDLSASGGFTVNGNNPATHYRTGDEVHIDASITKYLTKELSVGVIGSHYQQVTGDSGAGAVLGPFKGRDTAVGGTLGYNFVVGRTPVAARVKVLREVEVEKRFQGTITYFEISFPLWVPPPAASPRPVVARF